MNLTTLAIIVVVILFVVVRRARALIGRQKIRPSSLMMRLAIFSVLGVVVIAATIIHPLNLLGDVVGLVLGSVVAWYGLRLTVFEYTPDGTYYTPNMYIGLAVFAVFIVRFGYRLLMIAQQANTVATASASGSLANSFSRYSGNDPYTTAAYFILIGYYVVYYAALLLRHRQAALAA
ncbi:MAG: hypothetical protein ACTHMA_07205 [Thermomicrobiales bacterium]